MVSDRVSKLFLFTVFLLLILHVPAQAQVKPLKLSTASLDTLLARYHLEGVKIYIKKLGVISLNEKRISLKRNLFTEKLYINLQKNLTLDDSGLGAQFDYRLLPSLIIRGESMQRNWGRQSAINLIYRYQY